MAPESIPEEVNRAQREIVERTQRILRFRRSLTSESDRGVALATAAYLDVEIAAMLERAVLDAKPVKERFFGKDGAAGRFSARIDLAYLLGLIGKKSHADLHLIRKIRNEFAHNPDALRFAESPFVDRCRQLSSFGNDESPARQRFITCAIARLADIHTADMVPLEIKERGTLEMTDERAKHLRATIPLVVDQIASGEVRSDDFASIAKSLVDELRLGEGEASSSN